MAKKRYEQVAEHLKSLITDGHYPAGSRLPGTLPLVKQFKVSVSTVMAAQRLLERQGWVKAKPRSGFYVKAQVAEITSPQAVSFQTEPVNVKDQQMVMEIIQSLDRPDILTLGAAVPAQDLLPKLALQRAFRKALRWSGAYAGRYFFSPGLTELREAIRPRLQNAGCEAEVNDVVITDGCHEALSLALKAVTKPGDVVAVESPTYYGALQLIHGLGLQALEIPGDPLTGMSSNELKKACQLWPIKALLIIPQHSNPTGASLPIESMRCLLKTCEDFNVTLIENDIYGELGFAPLRAKALKSLDKKGRVIYCSSSSKTVSPGLRVGWMLAGRWYEKINYLKFSNSLATATLTQLGLATYFNDVDHDRHLLQMAATLEARMQQMQMAIQQYFPEQTRISQPKGGFVLWLELPANTDTDFLYQQALKKGISIAPGSLFSPMNLYPHCLRLNASLPWSADIEQAIKTLGTIAAIKPSH